MLLSRGTNLSTARAYVKERFRETGWLKVVQRLPAEDREKVWDGLILPTGWYDHAVHARFLDALVAEFRAEDPNLGRELGRRSAESQIKFFHSPTIAFVSPIRVLEQCARLWEEHYSEGRLEIDDRGRNALKILLANPGVHPVICGETLPGWGEQAILVAGAKSVHVHHVLCAHSGFSHCEYVVDWE